MNKGYLKFLKSKDWQAIKEIYYSEDNPNRHCFICGVTENLNIHHLSYKGDPIANTWGLLDPTNLVILCYKHHMEYHKNLPEFMKKWTSNISPRRSKRFKYSEPGPVGWVKFGDRYFKAAH